MSFFPCASISEVALDSFAVEFWGWVVLYSIVLLSMMLFKRSFRLTHRDLVLRVLFHRFQIIFDRIRLTFSVKSTATNAITAVSTVNIPKPRSCSWTYKISKLLVSPNERFNNIILERTIEYNTNQPQKFHGKRIQRYHWVLRGTWKERPKSTWPTHVHTCSSQVILSHVSVTVPVY